MELPAGRIAWDLRIATLSYLVAFLVCFAGCLAMNHMESHFGQQMLFSTIASLGCCSMHYTGALPPFPSSSTPFFPFPFIPCGKFTLSSSESRSLNCCAFRGSSEWHSLTLSTRGFPWLTPSLASPS